MTGFPPRVRLAARTRAGDGDPMEACCECCGRWLGLHGGEIQHRLARGAGGSKNPVVNGITNAALLCGNRYQGCHKKAEDRNHPEMEAKGFFIRHGNGPAYDPRYAPVILSGGRRVWFGGNGGYLDAPPEEIAA